MATSKPTASKTSTKKHKKHPGASAGKHSAVNIHIGLEQLANTAGGAVPRPHKGGIVRKPIPSTKITRKKK